MIDVVEVQMDKLKSGLERMVDAIISKNALIENLSEQLRSVTKLFVNNNLSISNDGDLCSKINNIKIQVRPQNWLTIANLKYHGPGVKLRVINVSNLTIEDRLLHYRYVHILIPHGSNYNQLLREDTFILWPIKE
ncbi:hypothetical protein CR513_62420, partial [Mucuna pruriens]